VPNEIVATWHNQAKQCSQASRMKDMAEYEAEMRTAISSGGGFIFSHHHSKQTDDLTYQYYEQDRSLSMMATVIESHTVEYICDQFGIGGCLIEPTDELAQALLSLPRSYLHNEVVYKEFLSDFGTHYLKKATMGGASLASTYFHSCLIANKSWHYVMQESSNSFMGVIGNWGQGSGQGWNKTDELFESESQIIAKLVGGDATGHLKIGRDHNISKDAYNLWQQSVQSRSLQVPLEFTLYPITDLITDPVLNANVLQALRAVNATAATEQSSIVQQIKPKDIQRTPAWCTCNIPGCGPHPAPESKPPNATKPPSPSFPWC